tara:strand:+ start:1906 stop:2379 length:474 start_codon:yes stop_codon:yes gene_type:complete
MREFYGVILRYAIVAAMAVTIMSLASCTKEQAIPTLTTKSGREYKLIDQGKYKQGVRWNAYDMGTKNSAIIMEVYSRHTRIQYVVQLNDAMNAWEMYDLNGPESVCWECIGDCIEDTFDQVIDDHTAVSFVGAALCPECAVAFAVGVTLGCASLQVA